MTRSTRTINGVAHLRCPDCKHWKPLAEFPTTVKNNVAYPRRECRECWKASRRIGAPPKKRYGARQQTVEDRAFESRVIAYQESLGNKRAREFVSAPKASMVRAAGMQPVGMEMGDE